MSQLLQPINGYIPQSTFGSRVVGPPGATLTDAQKTAARRDPLSFRYTAGRKAGCSPQEALKWLADGWEQGALERIGLSVVVYRQSSDGFTSIGMLGDLSIDAYDRGPVKRHEKTIVETQRKMAEYMGTTRMLGNPPVTAVSSGLTEQLEAHIKREPDSVFVTVDGIRHELWAVSGGDAESLCQLVDNELYITDGHHRLAAVSLVAAEEGRGDARIPVGVFSADKFRLSSFARCIFDQDLDTTVAKRRLRSTFDLEEVAVGEPSPSTRFEFGARVGGSLFRFEIPEDLIPDDPYAALNTNHLQSLILGPIFGVERPQLDKRLRFVPDLSGGPVDICPEADAWFLPFPREPSDVMTVADTGQTMPAKSTWFAPKLPSGLVIRPLDQDRANRSS